MRRRRRARSASEGAKRRGFQRSLIGASGEYVAAYYNYCWQTRRPGKSGKKRPSAAMMAKLTGHAWSFDELFDAVLC